MRAQGLATSLSLMPFPQHNTPYHKCLLHNLVLGCVGEYFKATCALGLFSPTPTLFDTTLIFTTLKFDLDDYFLLFLED